MLSDESPQSIGHPCKVDVKSIAVSIEVSSLQRTLRDLSLLSLNLIEEVRPIKVLLAVVVLDAIGPDLICSMRPNKWFELFCNLNF